ncbi:ABC transporter substrate-binding protein [Helicobacter sp. 13S00477-4]|uniref:ABC transporter substrate-binding protein n=1 Tax=Helicobacter sp. 13S00477-4 TaxID=1905759 RepID=UPI000BC6A161|nr:ABC transporter substrate-binding protein [Helicobacter sp. 13S00477-4]PAF52455.1 hypothetical protein BKH44_02730 [Helicobacter sp. 13S00477-4]
MKKMLLFLCLICTFGITKQMLVILDPAIIEITYMLGGEDRILAIAKMQSSQIYPKEKTSKLKSVGTFSNPSLEKIIALKPDIVILSSYSLNLENNLKRFGIKTLYLKADTLKEIGQNIQEMGKILDKEPEATKLKNDFEKKLQGFKENPLNKKGVFIYSVSPLMVFPNNTLPGSVFEAIGIKNIAANLPGKKPILSQEYILKSNPEIIFYGLRVQNQDELFSTNPLLNQTKASQDKEVFYIDTYSLLRGTPRILDNIDKIYHKILDSK